MQNEITEQKPIIRHCKNCQYSEQWLFITENVSCTVKHKKCLLPCEQRIGALFCRHFKKRGIDNAE